MYTVLLILWPWYGNLFSGPGKVLVLKEKVLVLTKKSWSWKNMEVVVLRPRVLVLTKKSYLHHCFQTIHHAIMHWNVHLLTDFHHVSSILTHDTDMGYLSVCRSIRHVVILCLNESKSSTFLLCDSNIIPSFESIMHYKILRLHGTPQRGCWIQG